MNERDPQRWQVLAVALALLMPTGVLAQSSSRTFYDASGRVSGHSTTDSGGSTTIYERVTGRTSTSGNQTTIYDASGRNVGRVTTTKPQGR